MKLFKPKNTMWVADKEVLAENIVRTVEGFSKDSSNAIKADKIYWLLDDYGVYFKPKIKEKSTPLWRLTAPFYYLIGITLMLILTPILYVLGKGIENTKIGYFFRL